MCRGPRVKSRAMGCAKRSRPLNRLFGLVRPAPTPIRSRPNPRRRAQSCQSDYAAIIPCAQCHNGQEILSGALESASKSMPAKDAKTSLGLLLDTARAAPITIERRGRAAIMILFTEDDERSLCGSGRKTAG